MNLYLDALKKGYISEEEIFCIYKEGYEDWLFSDFENILKLMYKDIKVIFIQENCNFSESAKNAFPNAHFIIKKGIRYNILKKSIELKNKNRIELSKDISKSQLNKLYRD
ncbi:MAG: hypothetical protein GY841_14235 [FCB group bacterium]|nr:hypothetical protein [FCB group bacterium]